MRADGGDVVCVWGTAITCVLIVAHWSLHTRPQLYDPTEGYLADFCDATDDYPLPEHREDGSEHASVVGRSIGMTDRAEYFFAFEKFGVVIQVGDFVYVRSDPSDDC